MSRPKLGLHNLVKSSTTNLHIFLVLKSLYNWLQEEAATGNAEEQPARNASSQMINVSVIGFTLDSRFFIGLLFLVYAYESVHLSGLIHRDLLSFIIVF